MSKEMVIGLPAKRGEDVFIRDEKGNVVGLKNTQVEFREEDPVEVANRKEYHDNKIKHEKMNGYKTSRAGQYPSFGEFADMMYWRIDSMLKNGAEISGVELEWYEKCKSIKEDNPKPTE